CARGDYGFAYW
nr:immunoglobulin heavy chain junction region [Mus musculus]MBK4196624.1 immunoglobulin heavy chain junction region [Mus musculus]MBK4196625.1 immunoglobulin heavy chain junction region [Mus musculus]